jgi:ABC-type multidrug transport system ATPase subunit
LLIPDSGTVHYDARPRIPARLSALAREGLFLLPDHDLLSNAFTVGEHLDFVRPRSARPDQGEVIETLGLARHLDAKPHELSSGERRRAEVAVAWIRRPRCLLADEPLRNIAPIDGELVLQVLRRMALQGCAVIVAQPFDCTCQQHAQAMDGAGDLTRDPATHMLTFAIRV